MTFAVKTRGLGFNDRVKWSITIRIEFRPGRNVGDELPGPVTAFKLARS